MKRIILLIITSVSIQWSLVAQPGSVDSISQQISLDEVVIKASKIESTITGLPYAVSSLEIEDQNKIGPQLSIYEIMGSLPGIFALNADNFAQDLRVAIRGFGARSAFGIRGIKIMVDELPESTPDGTAQVDNIDMGFMNRMEAIRGPSSGLFGNAAGGVLAFYSEAPSITPYLELRAAAGSYGFQQYQLKTSGQKGQLGYVINGSLTQLEGFREQAAVENTIANTKLIWTPNEASKFSIILNYLNSPKADDPGGINIDQVNADRRSARDQNLSFDAGETVEQLKMGLIFDTKMSNQSKLKAKIYQVNRDFANKLPFEFGGIVEIDRRFFGLGVTYEYQTKSAKYPYKLLAGIDFQNQVDDRLRFSNLEGLKGDRTLDQEESFRTYAAYIIQDLALGNKWNVQLTGRFDRVRLAAEDRFLSNGDDSGKINLERFNPSIGLTYRINHSNRLYGNVSTSFETPALSELSANPTGQGGFNSGLNPQKATNYEIGWKGRPRPNLDYEFVLFHINVTDELIPFELEDFPGRTFFNNAGKSRRNGLEFFLNYRVSETFRAQLNYTYSDFIFKEFLIDDDQFADNFLPGIPEHMGGAEFFYNTDRGLFGAFQMRFAGGVFADNANSTKVDGFALANLRIGYSVVAPRWQVEPFFGINNLFDSDFFSNVRINAFGSRYYEPAAGINFYAGIKLRVGK